MEMDGAGIHHQLQFRLSICMLYAGLKDHPVGLHSRVTSCFISISYVIYIQFTIQTGLTILYGI